MKITHVWFDLDGVLFDFKGRVELLAGKPYEQLTKKEMWAIVNKDIKFFENLRPFEDMFPIVEAVRRLPNIFVGVLSATGHNFDQVSKEKYTAVINTFPPKTFDHIKCVPSSEAKRFTATPSSILIDDSTRSINPWTEYGGIGILHTSPSKTLERLKKLLPIR